MNSSVREQYERYPYPSRDPAEERERLQINPMDTLAAIDHSVFGGRRDWTKPFRVLVAGGGTGDGVIAIAQQMADAGVPGEVVYLDLSAASRQIATERAAVRGLANITFRTGSLLELAAGDGPFDFINCIGVIHHLEDPAAGLRALTDVLAPDGGMSLMVYATLGRIGVYAVQDMLRQIAPASEAPEQRIAVARKLLAALPSTNLFSRAPNIGDHRQSDAHLYDLLLHSTDRSYLVGELEALITVAGLRRTRFLMPALYNPGYWARDPELLQRIAALSEIDRAAFAERFLGFIKQHAVFLVRAGNPVPEPAPAERAVPVWAAELRNESPPDPIDVNLEIQGISMNLKFTAAETRLVELIDGHRTIAEIAAASALPSDEFLAAFAKVWRELAGMGSLFLRAG